VPADAPLPPVSRAFVIIVFAVAIAVGGLIIYLGVNGIIGGPIP
jgi:hypothetical protein